MSARKFDILVTLAGGMVASVWIYVLGFYYPDEGRFGRWGIVPLWIVLLGRCWLRWGRQAPKK